jgi:hypothetical protein
VRRSVRDVAMVSGQSNQAVVLKDIGNETLNQIQRIN